MAIPLEVKHLKTFPVLEELVKELWHRLKQKGQPMREPASTWANSSEALRASARDSSFGGKECNRCSAKVTGSGISSRAGERESGEDRSRDFTLEVALHSLSKVY